MIHDLCETCGGHGLVIVATVETPFEALNRRRQQAHALGHRFSHDITTDCPDCDGHDRVTAVVEQQAELIP